MKKKGLIVATIVMVLVLAVSLTTATYAWFTTVSKTTVENISFSVGADSDVNIGLLTNHTLNGTNPTDAEIDNSKTAADFMWGDTTYNTVSNQWEGGTVGLGYMIDTQLKLDGIKKAVGTGVVGTSADTSWNSAHAIVKASAGENNTVAAGVEAATMQTDYLDVIFGVNASKEKVTQINCVITINPTVGAVLGMNAAIHVRWSLNGTTYYDCDIYNPTLYGGAAAAAAGAVFSEETTQNSYATTTESVSAAIGASGGADSKGYLGQGIAVNAGWASITIPVAKISGDQTQLPVNGTPTQIHLQIFIAGYDADCNNNAMSVASDIIISFTAEKAA